ncbi:MAG: anti-sigma factor family protein, partial [Thermoguttaceae bacterium]
MFNAENPLEEQLVAYLDGELDAESSRRIEELIASDAEIRGKLQRLQQTWEMLDELEFARVGEQFTHSTLEMVALAAEDDARAIMAEAPRRRRRGWLLGAIVLVAAGLAGFLAVSLTRVDPNRQLAADLPLLINFDRYLQIGNIDFLRLLHHAGLFLKPTGSAAHLTVDAPTPYDAAQYIHGLSSAEKAELQRKQNGFLALSAAEQNRLRQLHKQIQADSHSTDLYETMRAYYEWLKSLPAYTRIELQELSDTARIEWIKKRLHQEKLENAARLPSAKDAQVILSWLEEYASKRKQEFIDSLPLPQRQRIMSMKL